MSDDVKVYRSESVEVDWNKKLCIHVALCRCGASKNKPFCDGSHRDIDFTDPKPTDES